MMKKIVFASLLVLFASISSEVLAAGMGMGMGPPNPPCDNNPATPFPPCQNPIPIDGGIALLAGAGIALGARKMLKKKIR